jgi:hypothetical protein
MWIRIRNIAKKNLRFLMVKIRICSGCAHGSGPTTVIPTDDHFKTVVKKRPAPPMEELLENREKRSRFGK